MREDQKSRDLSVEVVSLLFRHKAHAEDVLTCSTNIHGEQIIHCLRIESFSIEVCKCGGNSLKALCCLLHGGLLSQNDRAGLSVSTNLKMSSQTAECDCDLVLKLRWNGVLSGNLPDLV